MPLITDNTLNPDTLAEISYAAGVLTMLEAHAVSRQVANFAGNRDSLLDCMSDGGEPCPLAHMLAEHFTGNHSHELRGFRSRPTSQGRSRAQASNRGSNQSMPYWAGTRQHACQESSGLRRRSRKSGLRGIYESGMAP
jgi:hypothetical protein